MLHNLLPDLDRTWKKGCLALTPDQPDYMVFYQDRTILGYFIINPNYPVTDFNKLVNMTWNELTSCNMLISVLYSLYGTNFMGECEAWFPFNSTLSPKYSKNKYKWYSGKNTPIWTGPKCLSLTRPNPKIFLKTCPAVPGLVSVQFNPVRRNLGYWVPQVFSL